MALERFIPKSPDSFIRNTQDFEVAKFGHLNTIVEYINSYVVADSLQLSGVGPLSATLRNITDAAGTYSKLLISTTSTAVSSDLRFLGNISGYVAIQAPDNVTTYTLKLPTTTGTNGQAIVTDGSGNLSFATVTTNAAGSTGQVQFNNANAFAASSNLFWDNTNSRLGVGTSSPTAPLHVVGGTYSPQGVTINAGTRFSTGGSDYGSDSLSSVGGGPMTLRAYYYTIINRANAGIAAQCLEIQGQTLIKGSGSTSATTSLLVQNSSGTDSLSIKDDGYATFRNNINAANGRFFIENVGNQLRIVNPYVGNYFWIGPNNNCGVDSAFTAPYLTAAYLDITKGLSYKGSNMNLGNFFASNTGLNYGLQINSSYVNTGAGGPNYGKQVRFYDNMVSSVGANFDLTFAFVNPDVNFTGTTTGNIVGYDFAPNIIATTTGTSLRAFQSSVGGVYINTTSYNASAILQADSTTQGFLPPRMTTAQKNAISSPAAGLQVYDTTLNRPCFYSGSAWVTL